MQSGDTLEAALAHARAGDESGFLMLWTDLNPRLLRYLRVLGCGDPDDVASQAWLQAIRDLERLRGNAADFRGWLFTVARHRAVDDARSRTRFRDKATLHRDLKALAKHPRVRALEGVGR
jgi:RNA polymerase sigma-70 factor (ECF subfamily)